MLRRRSIFLCWMLVIMICAWNVSPAQTPPSGRTKQFKEKKLPRIGDAPAVLWREPADITTRDLFWGPGGKEHAPKGKLAFIEEKLNGVNPKFDARDEEGV